MKTRLFWVVLALMAVALSVITLPAGVSNGQEKKEQSAKMSVEEALDKITLTEETAKKSRLEPTPGFARAVFAHKIEDSMKRVATKPIVVTREKEGKTFAVGLQYTCNPIYINTFTDANGNPLKARQFSFSVDTISWQAGNGWPVYTTYCPVNGYATNNYFPDAKTHQIVPIIMGKNYFVGCASSAVCASNGAGQIAFAVNDTGVPGNDYYSDNRGYFTVTVWGIIP